MQSYVRAKVISSLYRKTELWNGRQGVLLTSLHKNFNGILYAFIWIWSKRFINFYHYGMHLVFFRCLEQHFLVDNCFFFQIATITVLECQFGTLCEFLKSCFFIRWVVKMLSVLNRFKWRWRTKHRDKLHGLFMRWCEIIRFWHVSAFLNNCFLPWSLFRVLEYLIYGCVIVVSPIFLTLTHTFNHLILVTSGVVHLSSFPK